MPLCTKVYTTYRILLSSDKLRKGQVKSVKSNEPVKRPLETQTTSTFVIRSLFPEPNT
jgi:hypothetical protein